MAEQLNAEMALPVDCNYKNGLSSGVIQILNYTSKVESNIKRLSIPSFFSLHNDKAWNIVSEDFIAALQYLIPDFIDGMEE